MGRCNLEFKGCGELYFSDWDTSLPVRIKIGTTLMVEKRVPAVFFVTAAGTEPVREWLRPSKSPIVF